MRKILFFMLISLDGYFEGPERDIDWHNVDSEFNDFAIEQLDSVDTLLFGRVPYKLLDELRVMISPVVLRAGKTLFEGIQERQALKLLKTHLFNSGNILLHYEPILP
jgi:dihydrofolate reductase